MARDVKDEWWLAYHLLKVALCGDLTLEADGLTLVLQSSFNHLGLLHEVELVRYLVAKPACVRTKVDNGRGVKEANVKLIFVKLANFKDVSYTLYSSFLMHL